MKEIASYFISYIWVFGALLMWPTLKYWAKVPNKKLIVLKWLFWLQIFWLIASYTTVQYYRLAGNKDWLHTLMLPYVVGAISWVAVIIALFLIGIKTKKEQSIE